MTPRSPWPALWALLIGLFMTLIDVTIVSLANPAIKAAFDPASDNLDNVVWVTSAYLLGLAVPLLVTGRLGDRFGPKRIYLLGLVVFTLGSLTSGLSVSLEMLIAARAVQGVGAALMTPQTMAVITRTFPPAIRGAAMGLWGATSGVGMIVGPLLGGVLVGALGWQWVFFINVPLGIVGFILASIFVPNLETHPHRFDLGGVALSALGLFLVAFGLQEAVHFEWGVIWGPISVWSLIVAGVAVMVLFVWWQSRTRSEPLVPLVLFRDRNFTLASLAIAAGSFTMTSMLLPYMFFLQLSRGVSPIGCALLMMPMAVIVIFCSPLVGRLLDRVDPRFVIVPAFFAFALGMGWYVVLIATGAPILMFLLPNVLLGLGNAGLWGPLAATATRNLAPRLARPALVCTTPRARSARCSAAPASRRSCRRTSWRICPRMPAVRRRASGSGRGSSRPASPSSSRRRWGSPSSCRRSSSASGACWGCSYTAPGARRTDSTRSRGRRQRSPRRERVLRERPPPDRMLHLRAPHPRALRRRAPHTRALQRRRA